MMIDRVGGIGPGYEPRKTEPASRAQEKIGRTDHITISEEASRAAEIAKIARLARSSEDPSRAEKIKEVRQKLENGEYNQISDDILNKIADDLSGLFRG